MMITHARQLERELNEAKKEKLNAYKAGMRRAAEEAETAKIHIPADTKNYSAWASSDGPKIKQAILSLAKTIKESEMV